MNGLEMSVSLNQVKRKIWNSIPSIIKRMANKAIASNKRDKIYECPLCEYIGCFLDISGESGLRISAECPNCGSRERHRLQFLVMNKLKIEVDFKKKSILHFAPEQSFRKVFKSWFGAYSSNDPFMSGVDYKYDITSLPFGNESYDVVFASHVLEHIKDDMKALHEIKRILRPDGVAILPVPVFFGKTIEFGKIDKNNYGHVRNPGEDYYDRYLNVFSKVGLYTSSDFEEKFQLNLIEMPKNATDNVIVKRKEIVPVCFK